MSVEFVLCPDLPVKSAADLTLKQFYFVKLSGVWTVALVSATTDRALGVLQNKPNIGQGAEVRVLGVSKVISDGSGTPIVAGDTIGPNALGQAVKKVTADFNCAGYAMEASAALGTVIGVFLVPGLLFRTLAG